MVPSRSTTPVAGAQSVSGSLLRTNFVVSSAPQPCSVPSQQQFSSLVSARTQFNNNNGNNSTSLLGDYSNMSSLASHSVGNRVPVLDTGRSAASVSLQQRGGVGGTAEIIGAAEPNTPMFTSAPGLAEEQSSNNPSKNQLALDHSLPEQLEGKHKFQRQFSLPNNPQQALRSGLGNMGPLAPVKLEPQVDLSNKTGQLQHLQALRSSNAVNLEPQLLKSIISLGPVKLERQHSDSALVLPLQQQQQHQFLQMSRPPSQAAVAQISLLQQQRILQLQQQQHHILKTQSQQRNQLHQQLLQRASVRSQVKPTLYEPGMCARRLTHYMYHQQHRPEDNNIEFWRKFVVEYFAPDAKNRWCVSLYGNGRQTTGVFPQDVWHCEICNHKPGRGFETTFEVLPRLYQIKYASGTLEELLYVDMPREYQNSFGQIVLDYGKAIQESAYEQLRVVREGQLRIVFSAELKICSWEFCARRHEELVPRRLLTPQVSLLGTAAQKYQAASQNTPSDISSEDLQSTCNSFVASAHQLTKSLEVPLVNDLGYTKRYIRCLQISEVVNTMKDLIDYSRETGTGPMDSLINFAQRASRGLDPQQTQQTEQHLMIVEPSDHNDQDPTHLISVENSSGCNGAAKSENSLGNPTTTCGTSVKGPLHQRQENRVIDANRPCNGGSAVQIPSASSTNSLPPSQPNSSSPFSNHIPATSNDNAASTSHSTACMHSVHLPSNRSMAQRPSLQSHDADPTGSLSSVHRILQEMISSSQLSGAGNFEDNLKDFGRPPSDCGNGSIENRMANHLASEEMAFTAMAMSSHSATSSGSRMTMTNDAITTSSRFGMNHLSQYPNSMIHQQLQDLENRLLGGSQVSFDDLQFDWKSSP